MDVEQIPSFCNLALCIGGVFCTIEFMYVFLFNSSKNIDWLIHQKYPVRKDSISVHLSYYTMYFAVTKDCTFFSLIK